MAVSETQIGRLDDVEGHIGPIVLAFAADPFVRWLMPRPADFLDHFTRLTRNVGAVFAEVTPHVPSGPHWYLCQIGVDPALQRGGHGSALIAAGLAAADREGLPAYLEATSRPGVAFYDRHGFEARAEVQVGDAPPLWPMLRRPGGAR